MNPFLTGLTPMYAGAIALRNAAFDSGIFEIHNVPRPVISIGNITAGGSGKTPLVEYTATMLIECKYRCAIVSRGYRRSTKGTVVVSDGEGPLVDASRGGDEPVMLALHTPGATVIADEDRVRGCLLACERYAADVIVLDDAYQHRRVARDLDIVVYDASTKPRVQRLLPAGRLREPLRNIARADFIILSRCDSSERAEAVLRELAPYTQVPHAAVRFVPVGIREAGSLTVLPFERMKGRKAYAFCGIGAPASFEGTLTEAGITYTDMQAFPDHHRYTAGDMESLRTAASASGADYLVTTEKDAVRLAGMAQGKTHMPVFSILMGVEFLWGEDDFREAVVHIMKSRNNKK